MTTIDRIALAASQAEFDSQKSAANKEKHGIDFIEAQALWKDPHLIETLAEQRFLTIGKINGKHWSAVVTRRSGRLRIISVRRARKDDTSAAVQEGRQ